MHTPDYKTEDAAYTYSDGCGLCAPDVARRAALKLAPHLPSNETGTVMQFRMGTHSISRTHHYLDLPFV